MNLYKLVEKYTALTEVEINTIVNKVKSAPKGKIVCAGVWNGGDIMAIRRTNPDREIVAIDSFLGLDEPSDNDMTEGKMEKGEMSVGGVGTFFNNFKEEGLEPPITYAMFISEESIKDVKEKDIALLWLDLDHYAPTKTCLDYFDDKLVPGAIILVHDYGFVRCPGIKLACEEYREDWSFIAGGIYGLTN